MIDQIGNFLKEYGWEYSDFKSPKTGRKHIITHFSPETDLKLKVVILIFQKGNWLYASTHKLFKYSTTKEADVVLKFLQLNSQTLMAKWLTRDIKEIIFINIGFEIFEDHFSKEIFFSGMDLLSLYVDKALELLKEKGSLSEKNLIRVKTVTKDSFEWTE